MSDREDLLVSIAETIADYRAGDVAAPTPEHVDAWIRQFDDAVQEPMLAELDHVLKKTYISKETVENFLSRLAKENKLAGDDPCSFWKTVKFLAIQDRGNSQHQMLDMFDGVLQEECGFGIEDCGEDPEAFVYLDDGIFTGNTVLNDLGGWIQSSAPEVTKVHVLVMAVHTGGEYYADSRIAKIARDANKKIGVSWWYLRTIFDQKRYTDTSDVLRPAALPDDQPTRDYVATLGFPPVFRKPGSIGENKFFSCEEGRNLLEQEFLKAGVKIRTLCPHLNKYQRPLGNMLLQTLGFGSLIVTFRNCPNNAPLALWVGDPWYPLFPRKTN